MKKRDQILESLYLDKSVHKLIKKMCAKNDWLTEEGKQELFILLAELPEEELLSKYETGTLNYWIVKTLGYFFQSQYSNFYRKIKKFGRMNVATKNIESKIPYRTDENTEELLKLQSLETQIKELSEFDRRMIEKYLSLGCSYRKVAQELNLHEQLIQRSIKRIKQILKSKILAEMSQEDITESLFINIIELPGHENEDAPIKRTRKIKRQDKEIDKWERENYKGPVEYITTV